MNNMHVPFAIPQRRIVIVGFGSIGQAVVQLIFHHFHFKPSQITIISKDEAGIEIAKKYGLRVQIETITPENYYDLIGNKLQEGDFLLNLSVNISSFDLITKIIQV